MTNKTTTTTAEKITNALAATPGSTAADLAATIGLGRSTVTKHLATLERDGHASRAAGEQDGPRRTADRWNLATTAWRDPAAGERLRPGRLDKLVLDCLALRSGAIWALNAVSSPVSTDHQGHPESQRCMASPSKIGKGQARYAGWPCGPPASGPTMSCRSPSRSACSSAGGDCCRHVNVSAHAPFLSEV